MIRAILGAALLALSAPIAQAQAPDGHGHGASFGNYHPAAAFDSIHSASTYVRLRDGVRLAVRIDRPAHGGVPAEGKFPVIWHHSLTISQLAADGAGDRVSDFRRMPELVRHGYVVVQIARRGNGQSQGEMRGYHDRNETQDAFEMTEWLAGQEWSTGKVGMYGCSNTGDAAMQALTVRPPSLKAVFAGCFSWHKFDAFRRGGIFAQWGTGPSRSIEQDMALDPVDGDEDRVLLAQAAQEHQNSTRLFDMWQSLPLRDSWSPQVASRFWAEGSIASYALAMRLSGVPVYIQGGWLDELRDQGIAAWLNIPGSRLVIGPWKHCDNDDFDLQAEALRFFDQHLKGIDTGLLEQPPIHYFTMSGEIGDGQWQSADSWPVAGVERTTLHFGAGSLADRMPPQWSEAFQPRADVACPDAGSGSRIQPCHVPGAGPAFATAPLATPMELTGDPVVDLWIAADDTDANIFAYLEDVAPDGTITVITEGRQKASLRAVQQAPWVLPQGVPWHRSYAEDRAELVPGQPVRLSFAMMPTSWVVAAGHRLQVSITGTDHRERQRQPAEPPRITILGGPDHPSVLHLPVAR